MEGTCQVNGGERNEKQHGWFCMEGDGTCEGLFQQALCVQGQKTSSEQAWHVRVGEVQKKHKANRPCASWVWRCRPVGSFGPMACANLVGPMLAAGPKVQTCL